MHTSKPISRKSYTQIIILLFLVAASTLAVKINYFTPKKFQAITQLKLKEKIIENHAGKWARVKKNPLSGTVIYDAMLKNAIIGGIKNKNLNVAYFQVQPLLRAELYNSSPITVTYFLKNQNFYKQKFNFKCIDENNFVISYKIGGVMRERAGEFGKEIHETDLNFTVNKNTKINPAKAYFLLTKNLQFTISSDEAMADNILKSSIDVTSSETGMTTLSVTYSIPEKAMFLANSISESLLAQNNTSNTLGSINQELSKVTLELENARNEIIGNKSESKSSRLTNTAITSEAPFANIEEQKRNLELLSVALENLSDSLRKNRNIPDANTDYGLIKDPLITQYIDTLNEKITQRKNIAGTRTSTLNEEIENLQNTVADVVRNTRKKVALEHDKINRIHAAETPVFANARANESNLSTLNQKLFLTEKLLNLIADKKAETEGSATFNEGIIIQRATLPRETANANAALVWVLAMLLGITTGSLAAFILSTILKFTNTKKIAENENQISWFASIENGNKENLSFQFRNLCTKILLLREVGEKQIITVTSNSLGEGKSFVASHFAKSLASLDLNVLFIDMNLCNPTGEKNFAPKAIYTLADVLQKKAGVQEAIQISSIPGLDTLTAGNFEFGINSLIAGNSLNKILNELKGQYDFIIIDASDTLSSMDAMPCMKFSNATFFVTSSDIDEKSVFDKVAQIKTDYNIENIFFISNKVKYSMKQKQETTILQIAEREKDGNTTKTPFLKKVALWFY